MWSDRVFRQVVNLIPVIFTVLCGGYGMGWVSPFLYKLQDSDIELTTETTSLIGSLTSFGSIGGPFISMFLIDRIGRKGVLIFSGMIAFIGWLLLYLSMTVTAILISRLIFGVSFGAIIAVYPVYVAENSSPEIRGTLMSLIQFSNSVGNLTVTVVGLFLEYSTAHLIFLISGFVALISCFFLKESPQFLILKNKLLQASMVFHWLRPPVSEETEKYFDFMKENVIDEKSKNSIGILLRTKYIVKSLFILICFNFLLYSTGKASVDSFLSLIISDGSSTSVVYALLVIHAVINTCGNSSGVLLLESYNRKYLLFVVGSAMIFIHLIIATLYIIHTSFFSIPFFTYIIFVFLLTFTIVFSTIMAPISFCLQGEILPQSAKALGSTMAVSFSSLACFINSVTFLSISENYGMALNFFIYAAITALLLIFVYFKVPETSKKTLLDIQKELKVSETDLVHGRGRFY